MDGRFIVFEGIDGSGKSTQIFKLADYLRRKDKYIELMLAREPTRRAREVIHRLSDDKDPNLKGAAMARGYSDDRKDHWNCDILPWIQRGNIVLCDRYTLSTLVYQTTQGVELGTLESMHEKKVIGAPNLTFYLRLPATIAFERINNRGEAREKFENIEFMKKLAVNYDELITQSREDTRLRQLVGRIEVVDATQPIDALASNIVRLYDSVFS